MVSMILFCIIVRLFVILGEILVGLRVIDSSWWYGCSGDGRKGIFPTYLVWQLDVSQVQVHSKTVNYDRVVDCVLLRFFYILL